MRLHRKLLKNKDSKCFIGSFNKAMAEEIVFAPEPEPAVGKEGIN
jgi:hypothetical protein